MSIDKNRLPFNPLKIELAKIIHQVSSEIASAKSAVEMRDIYFALGPCAKPELGQFSFPTFQLAKLWKANPANVASELQQALTKNSHTMVHVVQATGPYLNFKLQNSTALSLMSQKLADESFFHVKFLSQTEKTMVEYSQPNTHKEMHVGHMRNLCLGASIVELYRFVGHQVSSCTYPGDVGTHVAKCLWLYHKNNLHPPTARKGAWLGSIYSQAHLMLEAERGTPQEEKNRQELTAILKEIHAQKGPYYQLWQETRQWSIQLMQDVYAWAGIKFDHWFFESEVDAASLKLVQHYYQKGLFKLDEGAIGIDLSQEGLGFCLLVKSDGNGLYATKDLELARLKFETLHMTKNIYIVDVRQSLHFKQVFKTLEKMGFEQAQKCFHLGYEMVELPDGAMSSRKGNIIPIQTLIDQMEATIREQYLSKYQSQWKEDEINSATHNIAIAAIKYGMLKVDPAKKIVFDLTEWLKVDGNSGPYLLYSYARAGTILQKAQIDAQSKVDFYFSEKAETDLLAHLWLFTDYAFDAAEKNAPSILCHYLYELCQLLNTFYAQCPILNASNTESKVTRLYLIRNFRQVLAKGLDLLGIATVERM